MNRAGGATGVPTGPFWTQIVALAHAKAYNIIVERLVRRGYTIAQILLWDMGPVVERTIALWESLVAGGALNVAPPELMEYWHSFVGGGQTKMEESLLSTVLLTVNNVWQGPADQPGTVLAGVPYKNAPDPLSSDPQSWLPDDYNIRW